MYWLTLAEAATSLGLALEATTVVGKHALVGGDTEVTTLFGIEVITSSLHLGGAAEGQDDREDESHKLHEIDRDWSVSVYKVI